MELLIQVQVKQRGPDGLPEASISHIFLCYFVFTRRIFVFEKMSSRES